MERLMQWLKENWKTLLGAFGTLGLSLIVKEIINLLREKKLQQLKEEEAEVKDTSGKIELEGTKAAGETHVASVKGAHAEADKKKKEAEAKKNERKEELEEDSEELDNALRGFGITEKK